MRQVHVRSRRKPVIHAPGFSLIELLITIVILAILVGIAIPSYVQYVTRSNRTDATTALSETAQALERCHTVHGVFDHEDCNVSFPFSTEHGHYTVTGQVAANTFTLTATPQDSQATRDTQCGAFTLNHAGVRGVSTDADPADCW